MVTIIRSWWKTPSLYDSSATTKPFISFVVVLTTKAMSCTDSVNVLTCTYGQTTDRVSTYILSTAIKGRILRELSRLWVCIHQLWLFVDSLLVMRSLLWSIIDYWLVRQWNISYHNEWYQILWYDAQTIDLAKMQMTGNLSTVSFTDLSILLVHEQSNIHI